MINRAIAEIIPLMPEKLIWLFSRKYIAGKTLDSAVKVTKELNSKNIFATIDVLGENISAEEEAVSYRKSYEEAIKAGADEKLKTTFSVKPTMFGLHLDNGLCEENIRILLDLAIKYNFFIRMDMEDSSCTDDEIKLFIKLYRDYPANIGIVLQSYLKRTLDDLKYLNTIQNRSYPINIRLCKGIYKEPPEIAYQKGKEVNRNFLDALEFQFENGFFSAIATHDKKLIKGALEILASNKVYSNQYEFQMLYGVRPELRNKLVKEGHPMRIYVPYGEQWFNYSTRRLKENPRIVSHAIKALFVRG